MQFSGVKCFGNKQEVKMEKLAINGGKPVRNKPFPAWPMFDRTEEKALLKIIASITSVFTSPLEKIIPATYQEQISLEILLIFVIVVIAIFWYTLAKLLTGIIESTRSIEPLYLQEDQSDMPNYVQPEIPPPTTIVKGKPQPEPIGQPDKEKTKRKNFKQIVEKIKTAIQDFFHFEAEEEAKSPFEKAKQGKKKEASSRSPLS